MKKIGDSQKAQVLKEEEAKKRITEAKIELQTEKLYKKDEDEDDNGSDES